MLGNKYDIILRDLGASAGLSILLFHLLNLVMQHFQGQSFKRNMLKKLYPSEINKQNNSDNHIYCWPFLVNKNEEDEIKANIE